MMSVQILTGDLTVEEKLMLTNANLRAAEAIRFFSDLDGAFSIRFIISENIQ